MKRIAVDMDEVLADALAEHLARYNRDHGESITKEQLNGKGLWDLVSADRHDRLEAYLRSEDFFEDLPVVEDSQEVLAKLAKHYEIFIATAAMEFPTPLIPSIAGCCGTFRLSRRRITCSVETKAFCRLIT